MLFARISTWGPVTRTSRGRMKSKGISRCRASAKWCVLALLHACVLPVVSTPTYIRYPLPQAMNAFIDAYEHQGLKGEKDDEVPMFHEWATVQPVSTLPSCTNTLRVTFPCVLTDLPTLLFRAWCASRGKSGRRSIGEALPILNSAVLELHPCSLPCSPLIFRQFHAAETAMPVIGCGSCLKLEDEKNFFFGKMLCHNVARCSYRMLTTCPVPVSQLACADRKACARPTTASGRRPTSSSLFRLAAW